MLVVGDDIACKLFSIENQSMKYFHLEVILRKNK